MFPKLNSNTFHFRAQFHFNENQFTKFADVARKTIHQKPNWALSWKQLASFPKDQENHLLSLVLKYIWQASQLLHYWLIQVSDKLSFSQL